MALQTRKMYPYPSKIDDIEDVRKYLSRLYIALIESGTGLAESLEYAFQDNWAFKTITGITNDVVADQKGDTLTLAKAGPLTIVGTAATDTITWTWAHLGIESLVDPNADRIAFYDNSEEAFKWLTATEGIQISTTNLKANIGGLGADASPDAAADYVMTLDATDSTHKKVLIQNLAGLDHGALSGLADDDHTQYILHSLAVAASDFLVASGANTFVKQTLAATGAILEADIEYDNLQGITANEHIDWTSTSSTFSTSGTLGCGTITTTGNLVLPANGVVGVTDGNPQIVFDNANNWLEITGKVGLGIAIPLVQFHNFGAAKFEADVDATMAFQIERHSATGRAQFGLLTEGSAEIWRLGLTAPGGNDFRFFDQTQDALVLYQNGDILMTPGGNVKIGAGASDSLLHIEGGDLTVQGAAAVAQIVMKDSAGNIDGYVAAATGHVGFFDADGDWTVDAQTNTYVKLLVNNIEGFRLGVDLHIDIYDWDDAVMREIDFGIDDSGGAGFKVLRIPN